jgi:hypothetical protein
MVLKMLLANGKISPDAVALLDKWRHTGFNAYCGPRILPWQKIQWKIWPGTSSALRSLKSG